MEENIIGHQLLTVFQPLRMRYYWNDVAQDNLNKDENYIALSHEDQIKLTKFADDRLTGNVFHSFNQVYNEITSASTRAKVSISDLEKEMLTRVMGNRKLGEGYIALDKEGNCLPDPELTLTFTLPLDRDPVVYFEEEILPIHPLAWISSIKPL
jgi:hypothetical protein